GVNRRGAGDLTPTAVVVNDERRRTLVSCYAELRVAEVFGADGDDTAAGRDARHHAVVLQIVARREHPDDRDSAHDGSDAWNGDDRDGAEREHRSKGRPQQD